ncbi:MAG: hypothetical protein ABFD52_04855 [Acidobacteriota bacterium]
MGKSKRKTEKPLTKMQLDAVVLLVQGLTAVDAAKKLAVGKSSVYRWAQLPAFKARLEAGRREIFAEATGQLRAASGKAVERLIAIMKSDDLADARLAATTILEFGFRTLEQDEFEARIRALEMNLAGRGLIYEVTEAFLPETEHESNAGPETGGLKVKITDVDESE